jgi:hypothetical protein
MLEKNDEIASVHDKDMLQTKSQSEMLATSVTLMISPPFFYSPAIAGGFQENNLRSENQMPFETSNCKMYKQSEDFKKYIDNFG